MALASSSYKKHKEKIDAAYELLAEDTTTLGKLKRIRKLIEGIDPKLDKQLEKTQETLEKLQKIHEKRVIELTTEHLPEKTKKQKKKKKLLLLFITSWKKLKKEVKRVQSEMDNIDMDVSSEATRTGISKIIAGAKGPLGIITGAAVVIAGAVAVLSATSVNVAITNEGCQSITPEIPTSVSLPGLKIPTETIHSGSSAKATLPPLTVTVDASQEGVIDLDVYGMNTSYSIPSRQMDIIFDGESLLGKRTTIDLGDEKNHALIVRCT